MIKRIGEPTGPDVIYAAGVGQHQMWAAQFISYELPRLAEFGRRRVVRVCRIVLATGYVLDERQSDVSSELLKE